jgi:anti-sigma regulatory factor (Ser/Thr protein kinase)
MVAVPGSVPVPARSEATGPIRWPDPGAPIFPSDPAAWPFSSHLELGALDSAVPCARLHARHVVREWGRPDLADTAELLVSELMTNAIRASGPWSPAVALWLFSDGRCVVIHVHDGSTQMPVRQDADAESDSGRGLLLVETLSRDWGSYRSGDGKVVWASIG